jgi:hypothetical protein
MYQLINKFKKQTSIYNSSLTVTLICGYSVNKYFFIAILLSNIPFNFK